MLPSPVLKLLNKGVRMPAPFSVVVGEEVDPERISPDGVVFYGGTMISGAETLISAGVKLGCEAPVAVADCRLGRGVELKGGFFKSSVFLEGAGMASGAQVREGCLLEEEANGGHTVGLKHTILFPFVTLGSLINFCDCLMAGGASRKDHSEVGSSYVHFNYTPNQDKATASLLGDVPRGVMLNRPPIFLGGQGGLVGPARIGFGTVIAAGVVRRGDCPESGKLLRGEGMEASGQPFHPGLYGDIRRRVTNNIIYLANLLALRQWYLHVRRPFFADGEMGEALYLGALETMDKAVAERLARFRGLAEKMERSAKLGERFLPEETRGPILLRQREFHERRPALEACLTDRREEAAGLAERDGFLAKLARVRETQGNDYIRAIRSLDRETSAMGTQWLQQAVDAVTGGALAQLPSFLQ
ncbi:MAG: UDP-N-acetylglucosamine pyrophosphorylase [Proteobacteria bacterium]|nr:UDP-N-acetylglucosamine pyrophosphorylase [Pseudomonadota bacterium]MBU2226221.1 UDP-N-acetylglucosamine pyrophosphorylase [Pseudomonadota bacterium]MBU2261540.1 UDP-N-acetylglucosamine pyrophosphorylase [Pseudomonadota bacterium]